MPSRTLAVLMLSLALVLGGGGVAQATLTGPGAPLHGCVDQRGVLHIVAFSAECADGQQSIHFGAQGKTRAADQSHASDPTTAISALQADVATLRSQVSALQAANSRLGTLLAGVSRSDHTLLFSGMNVQVESGSGSASTVNGLGNLIIGYNENPGTQTGSSNLVIGDGQSFTSHGGIVAGSDNAISAPYASVTGGRDNTASGEQATVTGGDHNVASDQLSSVAGGCDNLTGTATPPSGLCDSGGEAILGGQANTATGPFSAVSGGLSNVASSIDGSVTGGQQNTAEMSKATTVSGGLDNIASGVWSAISGGSSGQTTGGLAVIDGGYSNTATVAFSAVSGGSTNTASGQFSTVSGGLGNTASGAWSAILGGNSEALATQDESQAGSTVFTP